MLGVWMETIKTKIKALCDLSEQPNCFLYLAFSPPPPSTLPFIACFSTVVKTTKNCHD